MQESCFPCYLFLVKLRSIHSDEYRALYVHFVNLEQLMVNDIKKIHCPSLLLYWTDSIVLDGC